MTWPVGCTLVRRRSLSPPPPRPSKKDQERNRPDIPREQPPPTNLSPPPRGTASSSPFLLSSRGVCPPSSPSAFRSPSAIAFPSIVLRLLFPRSGIPRPVPCTRFPPWSRFFEIEPGDRQSKPARSRIPSHVPIPPTGFVRQPAPARLFRAIYATHASPIGDRSDGDRFRNILDKRGKNGEYGYPMILPVGSLNKKHIHF